MIRKFLAAALTALTLGPGASWAQVDLPPKLRGVGIDQHLDAQVPLDILLRDEAGRAVAVGDFCHGKPVLLVFAYFKCPMLCTLVLNGLVHGLHDVSFTPGNEFEILTVSFDARETPAEAAAKKKTYLERYGRPGAEAGWHFLTGDQQAIDRLTEAVGFHYSYDPKLDQFAHASGIMILTPEGKLSRYFYGIDFPARDLRLGLTEASAGKIGSPADRILLFCYHYDPETGKYGPAVMMLVRTCGALTVVVLATCVTVALGLERRRTRLALKSTR